MVGQTTENKMLEILFMTKMNMKRKVGSGDAQECSWHIKQEKVLSPKNVHPSFAIKINFECSI